jgi:hypothetical protein
MAVASVNRSVLPERGQSLLSTELVDHSLKRCLSFWSPPMQETIRQVGEQMEEMEIEAVCAADVIENIE